MKEKIKCKRCNLLYDKDSNYCPYCGEPNTGDTNQEIVNENQSDVKSVSQITFHRKNGAFSLAWQKHLYIILMAAFGLSIIVLIVSAIVAACKLGETKTLALTNLISYVILFISLLLILWKDLIPIGKSMANRLPWVIGLGSAAILIGFSYLYSYLISFANIGGNSNQAAAENTVLLYPVFSVIVFGILGPICEEIMYRIGLYGWLRKRNIWLAISISSIIFGLIHFNLDISSKEAILTELLNLPSYIISGAILATAYEFGGISASATAHIINNLIATIVIICA